MKLQPHFLFLGQVPFRNKFYLGACTYWPGIFHESRYDLFVAGSCGAVQGGQTVSSFRVDQGRTLEQNFHQVVFSPFRGHVEGADVVLRKRNDFKNYSEIRICIS